MEGIAPNVSQTGCLYFGRGSPFQGPMGGTSEVRTPLSSPRETFPLDIELHGVPIGRLEAVDWLETKLRSDRSSSWLAYLLDEPGQAG